MSILRNIEWQKTTQLNVLKSIKNDPENIIEIDKVIIIREI